MLPWAVVLTFGLPAGAPLTQQGIALPASRSGTTSATSRSSTQEAAAL